MDMSGPALALEWPGWAYFKFPPDAAPPALPPPADERTIKSPFAIDPAIYNGALDVRVPAAIATCYAITVFYLNAYNRRRGNKPWSISRTSAFFAFQVVHNILLAVYSAITFAAMFRALKVTLPRLTGRSDAVYVVDALCKMHGPRGFGDAATYNATGNAWEVKNNLVRLGDAGTPSPADAGRLWNEGLAFWGWIFYLSKFYEVLDTFIILAKGKRSSTLQTYHHAGAMLCMWAGIRHMSPPIWMFVFINSFIHSLMYTYYTVSTLGIRVPQAIKRTLTTMQITQFVVGATFASLHLFVHYSVPVSTSYPVVTTITSVVEAVSSSVSSAVASATASAAPAGGFSLLKKLVYRAAGHEGLAENVRDDHGHAEADLLGQQAEQKILHEIREWKYRKVYHRVPCIDTTGQSFAIWLNVIYLLPLTWLFARFFVRSYLRRTSSSTKHPTRRRSMSKATRDAIHGLEREIESLGKSAEDEISKLDGKARRKSSDAKRKLQEVHFRATLEQYEQNIEETLKEAIDKSKQTFEEFWQMIVNKLSAAEKKALDSVKGENAEVSTETLKKKARKQWDDAVRAGKVKISQLKEKTAAARQDVSQGQDSLQKKIEETLEAETERAGQVKEKVDETAESAKEADGVREKAGEAKEASEELKEEDKGDTQEPRADEKPEGKAEPPTDEDRVNKEPEATGGESSYIDVKQEAADQQEPEPQQDSKPAEDANGEPKEGLSSTDPKETGKSYSDVIKDSEE